MSTGNSAGYKEQMWNTFKVNVGVFTNMWLTSYLLCLVLQVRLDQVTLNHPLVKPQVVGAFHVVYWAHFITSYISQTPAIISNTCHNVVTVFLQGNIRIKTNKQKTITELLQFELNWHSDLFFSSSHLKYWTLPPFPLLFYEQCSHL